MKCERVLGLGLGLLIAGLVVNGCGTQPAAEQTGKAKEKAVAKDGGKKKDDHAPHGAGPNGGVLFDLGKYHAEFTVDHGKKECYVLVLGDDEKTPTAVAAKDLTLTTKETKTKEGKTVAPMTIKLFPKDVSGGKATKYVGADPGLGNVADFAGTIAGEIDGKPSQGEFKE